MRRNRKRAQSKGGTRTQNPQNGTPALSATRWNTLTCKGSKIRGTYVKWAVNEKRRLEDELEQKRVEISAKEAEVETTRSQAHLDPL